MQMQLLQIIFLVFLATIADAAPPSRVASYVNDQVISSDDVSNNENQIFNYLQNGVDTFADGSIVNADVASNAAIQSDKLNLASIAQLVSIETGGLRPDKVTSDPCNTADFPEGSIFYNDTSNYVCFCNASNADVQMHSPSTACF